MAIGTAAAIKVPRQVFNRDEALRNCPEYLRPTYQELFRQIDELDLGITLYELEHGKRNKPPREQLVRRFTEEEQADIAVRARSWSGYKYLK